MQEDIDGDFEFDWDAYNSMDDETKQLRRGAYKLFLKYNSGKISYHEYLERLYNDFTPVLSDQDWREIEIYKKEKEIEEEKIKLAKIKKQEEKDKRFHDTAWQVIIIVFVLVILFGIIQGISGKLH